MTRRPSGLTSTTSELYAWLLAREEAAELAPGRALPWSPELPGYQGSAQRLAALRAGEAVTVYAGCLPKWAREGVPATPLTFVRVDADGGVELRDDGARLFADENGL
jgi:hypothetical protein